MSNFRNNFEIKILREYLRIPSVHPNVDYRPCIEFLKRQARFLGLPLTVYYPVNKTKPIVVITWLGLNTELKSIMFNSHMDVVPVYDENWTHPPFNADIDMEGKIFARGVQDTKALGMQYLAAIRMLKRQGFQGYRTAHITFMPEEETGGIDGMKAFVQTKNFQDLNIGFAIDEGYASRTEKINIVYGERTKYQVRFKIRGLSVDVSRLPRKSAGEKFNLLLNKIIKYRKQQQHYLKTISRGRPGHITSINLTQVNTITNEIDFLPQMIEATFDIRLAINVDPQTFRRQLQNWCREAGGDIEIEIIDPDIKRGITAIDSTNIFWTALKSILAKENIPYKPVIMSGSTDMRFLRDKSVNIPALGFSPMPNTPMLAHNHDEYLHSETYLKGIEIFTKIMPALLNVGVKSSVLKKSQKAAKVKPAKWKI